MAIRTLIAVPTSTARKAYAFHEVTTTVNTSRNFTSSVEGPCLKLGQVAT
jgi:hypothetical protein